MRNSIAQSVIFWRKTFIPYPCIASFKYPSRGKRRSATATCKRLFMDQRRDGHRLAVNIGHSNVHVGGGLAVHFTITLHGMLAANGGGNRKSRQLNCLIRRQPWWGYDRSPTKLTGPARLLQAHPISPRHNCRVEDFVNVSRGMTNESHLFKSR